MAGRKPKPTAIKELEGNPGKRKLNKKEPKPDKGMPVCPEWLLPEAKDEWKRLSEKLKQMGVLTEVDMAAFAAYCQSYARWKEAQEHIDSGGSTFETDKGYQQQTLWVGIANTNQKLMLQAAAEFGLTPSARTRIMAAVNADKQRYEGIAGMMDYKKVVQLIKDGGYATSLTYVEKLCSIIEKWNLTQYDVKEIAAESEKWYRVRKSWADAKSQKGAYKVLKNAKACADKNDGYSVYDWNGNVVYAPSKTSEPEQKKVSYRVRVSIKNLNIRKGPGTNYDKTGKYTGIGVFTIVAESDGEGATKWGKLKSGAGWISLDFAKRI